MKAKLPKRPGSEKMLNSLSKPHPSLGLFERIQQFRALLLGKHRNFLHRGDGHGGGAAAFLLGSGFVRHVENIAPSPEIHRCDVSCPRCPSAIGYRLCCCPDSFPANRR